MTKPLTVQHELFGDNVSDAAVLSAIHWKELYGNAGFRVDFGGVVDTEAAGGFKYFTLRNENEELVGHLGMMVIRPPYYGKIIAMDIFYFVLPEFRGTFGLCKLFKFAAASLQAMGVQKVNLTNPVHVDLAPVLKRAGYVKTGETYTFGE